MYQPWAAAPGLASSAWALMSDFVHGHDPADELRRELGLGRGGGRVKALLSLAKGPLSLADLTANGRDVMRKAQDIIARPLSPLRDLPAGDLRRLHEILSQLARE